MQFFVQSPTETIEYQLNWLDSIGEATSITDSDWVAPDDVELASQTIDGSYTAAKVSYIGDVGERVQVQNTVTLDTGETLTDSIFIYFENK
jgi:hypothetical protein